MNTQTNTIDLLKTFSKKKLDNSVEVVKNILTTYDYEYTLNYDKEVIIIFNCQDASFFKELNIPHKYDEDMVYISFKDIKARILLQTFCGIIWTMQGILYIFKN